MRILRFTALVLIATVLAVACNDSDSGSSGGSGTPQWPDPGPRTNPLPAAFLELDYYWDVEHVADVTMPVKLAQAPDGRLFVSKLDGEILVIEPGPGYAVHSFANELVLGGPEQGLLGIELSPNFASNGHVFIIACVNDITDKMQVIRYTDSSNTGTGRSVVIDNLPTNGSRTGGAIRFALDGTLFVSIGDTGDEALAQTNGSLSGRVLRYNADGTIPTDNPRAGSADPAEWVRGLRNSWGLCVHPVLGTLVATENGPADNDGLNYLAAGKNFEWGAPPQTIPGAEIGIQIRPWPTVIVPTGLTYHSGNNAPPWTRDNLFICSYEEEEILRFVMDGVLNIDIESEHVFARFDQVATANKPLDIIEGIDGSLYVSTFSAIWRVFPRVP